MIYLDNGATTFPKPDCVWDAVDHFNRTTAVNAGRGAYQAARDATAMIREVREQLVSFCDAREQAQVDPDAVCHYRSEPDYSGAALDVRFRGLRIAL